MPEKILIIGPAWIGDMIMSQSLIKRLKSVFSDSVIDVIAPEWSGALVSRMPEVRKFIPLNVKHGEFSLKYRWNLGKSLRDEKYSRCYVLPITWKSAIPALAAKIPLRIGYFGEVRFFLLNRFFTMGKNLNTMVKRYLALADKQVYKAQPATKIKNLPFPKLSVDKKNRARLLQEFGLNKELKRVALVPGAEYGASKRWPLEYYRFVAESLVAKGLEVIVLGGAKEVALGEAICKNLTGAYNLCGKTSLTDAIDTMSLADLAIANDSGLMHLASAVDINVFAIYGATSPDFAPPLTNKGHIFYQDLDCSPCKQRECPFGHTDCLYKIKPNIIIQKALTIF